jgi:hypothetical protein
MAMKELEKQFCHAMNEVTYFANSHGFGIRFKQMIEQYGARETAKRLLSKHEIQTGLMRLWELKALDKSMEWLVVQERFQSLFTQSEIDEAKRRLYELGYFQEEPKR